MSTHRVVARLTVGLFAVLLMAAGCSSATEPEVEEQAGGDGVSETVVGGDPGGGTEPGGPGDVAFEFEDAEAGTLVWVHGIEPIDLHADDPDNIAEVTDWVQQGLLEGLYGVDENLAYYPELLAADATVEQLNSGTVVIDYRLRDGLRWSDGTPLTAADVAYTYAIIVEGCEVENDRSIIDATDAACEYDLSSRVGYELITDFDATSDTEFTVTMAAFYPGWRSLFSTVFAAHAFGADAATVNDNLRQWSDGGRALPSSGPVVFESWTPGVRIELARNDAYHGAVGPDGSAGGQATVERVRLDFVGDLDTQLELLREGRAHVVMADLDPRQAPAVAAGEVVVDSVPGPSFDHLALNLLDVHLGKPGVREAVAHAIDKSEIVAELYVPLVGARVPEAGLGNAYWMANQADYVDHQARYGGGESAVAEALESEGYSRGNDGVWSHPEDGRLSLRAATTGGNALREQELDLVQEQLGRVGIEIVIENKPGGLLFTEGPFSPESLAASASEGASGDADVWDMALFGWTSGPWPGRVSGAYRAGSNSNPYGFNNIVFDVAATDCDAVIDDGERAGCYNELDTYVTSLDQGEDGLFVIPLTQKPMFVAHSAAAVDSMGVVTELSTGGPLVDFGAVRLKS